MKKLFSILIVVLLIIAMNFTVYAKDGADNGPLHDINDDKGGLNPGSDDGPFHDLFDDRGIDSLEDFRELLNASNDDLALRQEIMKRIIDLRKAGGDHSIVVFVNGKEVNFDVPPVIRSSRTLIPIRAITSSLGAQVDWSPDQPEIVKISKIVVEDSGAEVLKVIVINLDTEKVTVNGVTTTLDVPPMIISNRTMVPIRFVAETFNMNIDWNSYVGGIVADSDDNSN